MTVTADRKSTSTRRGRHRLLTPMVVVPGVVVAGVVILALFAPLLFGEGASSSDITKQLNPPSIEHPFGTDRIGRDILLRTLVGTTLSTFIALGATAITVLLGAILGLAPLVLGRRGGAFVTRLVEVMLAFPSLLLVLFFAVVWNAGALGAMMAVGLAGAPAFARLTKNLAVSVDRRDFVSAVRVLGLDRIRTVLRHVLPNIGDALIIAATTAAGGSLMVFAGLSFLGIGVQPPDQDWGRLLNEGLSRIYSNPMAALGPALMIVIAGLAFNVLGEGLAVALGRESALASARRHVRRPAPTTTPTAPTPEAIAPDTLLEARNVRVCLPGEDADIALLDGVGFSLAAGSAVGIVGESGSGKSLTAAAIAGLVDEPLRITADALEFDGIEILSRHSAEEKRRLGSELAFVFQDPMSALNPRLTVGSQMTELARTHLDMSANAARERAEQLLTAMGIAEANRVLDQYPHQLSGGMRQRVTIAAALIGPVRLLVADEPTTALDVTVQLQVLEELREARRLTGTALLLISHDIAVVSALCDRILVMYSGRIVEDTTVEELRKGGRHPYTQGLLASTVTMSTGRGESLSAIPGVPPLPAERPAGCAFAPRCPRRLPKCESERPELHAVSDGSTIACWNPAPLTAQLERSIR